MSETIVLDPSEFAPNRVELGLDDLGLKISKDGADWGESQVAVQLARQQIGSTVTDRHLEPVEMSIPLQVMEEGAVSLAEAAAKLQAKVGIFQSDDLEPNWLRRDFDDGGDFAGSVGYVIHTASLQGLQGWYMANRQHATEVTLKLLRSPLCYSTVEVSSAVFTEESARELQFEIAEMLGTAPGLIRVKVKNIGSENWRAAIVSLESRDHPQDATKSTTAAMAYECEALTMSGGTAEAALAGASGGKAAVCTLTAAWITVLSSKIVGVGHMTHKGVRRMLLRALATEGVEAKLEFRTLGGSQWVTTDVTALPVPVINELCYWDLGESRPELAILGDQRWEWRIQARATTGSGTIKMDRVYPLSNEQLAIVSTPVIPPAATSFSQKVPTVVKDDAGIGSVAWTNPENAKASDNAYATAKLEGGGVRSHNLLTEKHGFAIPEGATITGIMVEVERTFEGVDPTKLTDYRVRLLKGGAFIFGEGRKNPTLWALGADQTVIYGGTADLWDAGWTPAQINANGFGAGLAVEGTGGIVTAKVDLIRITVYYTEATDPNRVCFASRSIEFRSDGVFCQDETDDVWGELIPEGFYLQAPPSWLEGRAMKGLILPSQGDLGVLPDVGTNKIQVQVLSRAGYHFAREAI